MNFSAGSLNSKTPSYRPRYDDRKGLGYGVLEPTFDVPRPPIDQVGVSTSPYPEPDPYEDLEDFDDLDPEELDAFVAKINQGYIAVELPGAHGRVDPFAYASGNRPVGPIGEMIGVNPKLASPFPGMYRKRTGTGFGGSGEGLPYGGPTNTFRTHGIATGSRQGWSASPPESVEAANMLDEPVDYLDEIPEPDERTLQKLRKVISLIHQEEEEALQGSV